MRRSVAGALALGAAAAAFAIALLAQREGWLADDEAAGHALTRPLRLEVASPAAYQQLLLALRVHHYRPQPRNQRRFRDLYYDTPGWDLYRHGYSYRLRRRLDGSGGSRYSLRLERELRFAAPGAEKLELASELPDEAGAAIEAGATPNAMLEVAVEPAERLRALLRELRLDPTQLQARLEAELERERLDVSEKGQQWFELDHEAWRFRLLAGHGDAPPIALEDVVIDTRLGRHDPELGRRVRTMQQLVRMVPGIQALERAPHERAIEAAIGAP